MKSFIFYAIRRILERSEDEMDRKATNERDEIHIHNFIIKTRLEKTRDHFGDLDVQGRIIF
jgi:hypothetical protein